MSQQHTSQGYDVQGLISDMGEESVKQTGRLLFLPRLFQAIAGVGFLATAYLMLVGYPDPISAADWQLQSFGRLLVTAGAFIVACLTIWVAQNVSKRQKTLMDIASEHRR